MGKTVENEFGRYVRRERVASGVSLRSAAKTIGVSAVYLGEVERGVRPPLRQDHWKDLIRAIPSIDRDSLERLTARVRPIQMDLRESPPRYQDLGLALARRIEKQDISRNDLEKLFSILGEDDG